MEKLIEWMQAEGVNPAGLARKLGVSPSTVTRILNGERIPGRDLHREIFKVTNGFVRPDHFYDLRDLEKEA